MWILKTIAAAFSMFSAVPMPQFPWDESNMRYMLCAFPLVGALIGGLCWGWCAICGQLALPAMLRGIGLCLIPFLVTGGIHLDGFCDTWDALSSHGSPERKRAILKDPHMGAFAAAHLVFLALTTFALWIVIPVIRPVPVLLGFCLSRSLSALAVASFPLQDGSGLAKSFAEAADRKKVRVICLEFSLLLAAGLCLSGGWAVVPAAALVFLFYRFHLLGQFGGLSGDLAGWFLQEAELFMLIALYAQEIGEGLR